MSQFIPPGDWVLDFDFDSLFKYQQERRFVWISFFASFFLKTEFYEERMVDGLDEVRLLIALVILLLSYLDCSSTCVFSYTDASLRTEMVFPIY